MRINIYIFEYEIIRWKSILYDRYIIVSYSETKLRKKSDVHKNLQKYVLSLFLKNNRHSLLKCNHLVSNSGYSRN